jgi:uncharacterized protein
VELVPDVESDTPRLGVSEAGRHAAEALIIARYMMFNQVYFHKTRVILDHHLALAVRDLLPGGTFPSPVGAGLDEYLKWDDWRVLGAIADGAGGEHGSRLHRRDFFREVWDSPEFPNEDDEAELAQVEGALGHLLAARCEAMKSWYKIGELDLPIAGGPGGKTKPLSLLSTLVGNMKPTRRTRLYVKQEDRAEALERIKTLGAANR